MINASKLPNTITGIMILVVVFGLSSHQLAKSTDLSNVIKAETPAQLAAVNSSGTMSDMLRHIDPLDEGRASSTHRGKDPHGKLTADQQISVALQHFQEGRKPQAMIVLSQALEKFPKMAKIYDVRASLELQSGNTREALADIEKAVQLDPDNPIYLVNRSQVYLKFHRQQAALNDLDKAIALNPDLIPARFNRGSLLAYQGKNQQAINDFDQCIALNPHLPAPYFNRASVYHSLKMKDKAIKDIKNFIKITTQENWKKSAQDLLKAWQEEKE
jgi:tetratricopeptide (TPR) repeat protein